MTKQNGGPDRTPEGSEIRRDVVDGGDESLVHDMGDSYEDTTREGRGQQKTHHGRSLAETPSTIRQFRWVPPLIVYPKVPVSCTPGRRTGAGAHPSNQVVNRSIRSSIGATFEVPEGQVVNPSPSHLGTT